MGNHAQAVHQESSSAPTYYVETHRETLDHEVFIGNHYNGCDFDIIKWTSRRKGTTAYHLDGSVSCECFPVFIARFELENAGFRIVFISD